MNFNLTLSPAQRTPKMSLAIAHVRMFARLSLLLSAYICMFLYDTTVVAFRPRLEKNDRTRVPEPQNTKKTLSTHDVPNKCAVKTHLHDCTPSHALGKTAESERKACNGINVSFQGTNWSATLGIFIRVVPEVRAFTVA